MKSFFITLLLLVSTLFSVAVGQENPSLPQRTPEQEATKQTEKLQQELNLTIEQAKQIYEINLRYARERQLSNKRSEAMERMKNKNAEIQQVLTQEQNDKLQSKRYERTNPEPQNGTRIQPMIPSAFRPGNEPRTDQTTVRVQGNGPVRSSFRPALPSAQTTQPSQSTQSTQQQPQAVRRTVPQQGGSEQPQTVKRSTPQQSEPQPTPRTTTPSTVRPQIQPPTFQPRRTEPATPAGGRR